MKELYSYIFEVKESTEKIIKDLSYIELKRKVSEERILKIVECRKQ